MLHRNVLAHILFTLFVVALTAEVDKLLFRALSFRVGWVPVSGGAITVYSIIVAVVVSRSLLVSGTVRVNLWTRLTDLIWDNRLFLLNFLGLIVLFLVYWLADTSADSELLVDALKGFLICLGPILLFAIRSHIRRTWRVYLSISFVVY